ncbi:MAG: exo-alpha-sialidase [Thermogutta sp.]
MGRTKILLIKPLKAWTIGFALLITVVGGNHSAAEEASSAIVSRQFVFESAPFKSCHASTIVETRDGLLAAWFGGDREGAENVGIWLSRLTENGWTEPVEVANGIQENGNRYPCWNPVLFQPKNGPLVLFYKVGPSPSAWWGMMMTSRDAGRTWDHPRRLPDGFLGPIKNKPIELEDGTWLCPSSTETPEKPSRWRVHFELTRDGGTTWEKRVPPVGSETLDAIQPSLLMAPGGRLIAVGRTRQHRLFFTASYDQGQTWTTVQRTTVPNPNSGVDAVTLTDGRQLLVYNHTTSGRSPLNVALSDDAVKWSSVLVLEDQPGEFSYPSVIQAHDGLVHIVYTWKRQRICHVVLDPNRLQLGRKQAVEPTVAATSPAKEQKQPNVVIVITDDQGLGDFSCMGNPILWTPHIDRLAAEGVRLTDFHVAPVCTPTRGQLMTGQDALRNGARSVPAGTNMMWRNVPTMAEIFRSNGYRTGLFGKWHLGDHYPDRPADRGFEKAIWFGGWGVSSDVEFDNDCLKIRYRDANQVSIADRYCTDFWFDQALAWMEECSKTKQPFFCYIATNAPHGPLWAQEKDALPYRTRVPGQVADFFGMIANIDENMGRLENWLIDSGLRDNTIVTFMTDNGGTAGRKVFNAGLREGKGSYYDGGHRVPCVIRWPAGRIQGGREVNQPTQVQDILPTLVELCRLNVPSSVHFDGIGLATVLRDPQASLPDRMMVVQYGGRTRAEKNDGCVIWGHWRLVKGKELYDVSRDPGQERDVSQEHPDVVEKMRRFYDEWWEKIEPRVYDYQPLLVGTDQENPVILSSNYWAGVDVDNHHRVSAAEGGPRGGPYYLEVTKPGRYRIELRRWPFHCQESLGSPGPKVTVAGRSLENVIRSRKALPIAGAVLSIANQELQQESSPDALGIVFDLTLPAGRTTLQGWFRDSQGQDLCGAYYVSVERVAD